MPIPRQDTRITADVALLTDSRYTASEAADGDWYLDNILREDALLQAALERLGQSSVRVDWSRPDLDWSSFRCAVFRTTWDYFDRFAEFSAWLQHVRSRTRLCNDAELISWNIDKHYLADLETRGVPVVRSQFVERGAKVWLPDLLSASGWEEAIIKPCVSGGARHTYRINRQNASDLDPVVQSLLANESLILQPFERRVLEQGEDSLMVFQGVYSHAVRKLPKPGDFRVQDDHGGTVHSCEPTRVQIDLAERAMAACVPRPAYGRVDLVRDDQGDFRVMELELIEPELWLRVHPPSAAAFADAIALVLSGTVS